jgi:hypothetical protein
VAASTNMWLEAERMDKEVVVDLMVHRRKKGYMWLVAAVAGLGIVARMKIGSSWVASNVEMKNRLCDP